MARSSAPSPQSRSVSIVIVGAALIPSWFAWAVSNVLVGWLAFDKFQSPAIVGLAYIVRLIPLAVVGLPAGVLSDRVGRTRVFLGANLLAALAAAALGVAALEGPVDMLLLLAVSFTFGVADAGRLVTGANLGYDIGGHAARLQTVAFVNVAAGIGQAGGGLVGGYLLGWAGIVSTSIIASLAYVIASAPLLFLRNPRQPPATQSLFAQVRQAVALVSRPGPTSGLVMLALASEIFGFSAMALDPVLAGAVFATGPIGLGVIAASRSVGRLFGMLGLTIRPPKRTFRPLIAAVVLFGVATIGYASSPTLALAIVLIGVAGLAGGIVDSLEQTALQLVVTDQERGAAAGLWVLTLGFGPVGIGALAGASEIIDVRVTLGLSGAVLAAFGLYFWKRFQLSNVGGGDL